MMYSGEVKESEDKYRPNCVEISVLKIKPIRATCFLTMYVYTIQEIVGISQAWNLKQWEDLELKVDV
jgi:hypothetical protein